MSKCQKIDMTNCDTVNRFARSYWLEQTQKDQKAGLIEAESCYRALMTLPMIKAFGAHAPRPWQQRIIALTRTLPETWLGRRLALWLRKPVLKSLGQQPVDLELLGFRMRLLPFDNVSEKRVMFTPQFFDSAELALLRQRIQPGFQFVDVGANAGLYSLFVAARTGPDARILAIDPQPAMLERLETNIVLNGFTSIQVAPVAVSDQDGVLEFHLNAKNRGGASINATGGEVLRVPCRLLLALMDEAGITQPDAMKIDIEGAEDLVFGHFLATAPRSRWPKLLFMERNSAKWRHDVLAFALAQGYRELTPGRMNVILELSETAP